MCRTLEQHKTTVGLIGFTTEQYHSLLACHKQETNKKIGVSYSSPSIHQSDAPLKVTEPLEDSWQTRPSGTKG